MKRAVVVWTVLLLAADAAAVPGPETTAVVANANDAQSVALAEAYVAARDVPDRQLCLLDLPSMTDVSLDEFRTRLLEPLRTCLGDGGVLERIEAVLLVRGVPLRVAIPVGTETRLVSLAAALMLWDSTMSDGTALLGREPGRTADCGGTPCYAANWNNPFRSGVFGTGWTATVGLVTWRPVLVTMLHGRSYEDAALLLDSALAAEAAGGARGEFLFMDGADPARAALDLTYDGAIAALHERGFADAARVPFGADTTGHTLAAFFTGTASLGTTIEGNTFLPGALVDNLTSFGAVPENFEPTGESQVSIARWVAMGVAGVHGTTSEPLNNVFPNRWLVVDYVDGSTLAEAFHRRLPNAYWHNLVLGDPMAAPYAPRPTVAFEGLADGDTVEGSRRVTIRVTDRSGRGVEWMKYYADGLGIGGVIDGGTLEDACLALPPGDDVQVLAVAQLFDDGSEQGQYRPKGWSAVHVRVVPGPTDCPTAADADADGDGDTGADADTDGGTDVAADGDPDSLAEADSSVDSGGSDDSPDDGCGCRAPGDRGAEPLASLWIALGAALILRRSRR
ncbi:MAG: TIGR03790 family protein [Acidobacteria bacterium]|nr:TIGR03790 family protein [Acidobacteriota bacterium]